MGKRVITGKISLYLFGMVNMLMLLGPALLPAYRSYIKIQYARIWRNRSINRHDGLENTNFRLSKTDFEKFREGRHEIWLGKKLYDIASFKIGKDSVDLQLDFDLDETRDLKNLSAIQQKIPAGSGPQETTNKWLHWLSELVTIHLNTTLPVKIILTPTLRWPAYSSAILHCYLPVAQEPPDGHMIS